MMKWREAWIRSVKLEMQRSEYDEEREELVIMRELEKSLQNMYQLLGDFKMVCNRIPG